MSKLKPIIFYDIPSTLPGNAWSPNTWKTRYALNVKGIPYTTVWVEYPDIEPLAIELGAFPIGKRRDGSTWYTLPIINDPNTGKVVSSSFFIAGYLEATYTGNTTLFPFGTRPLIEAFESAFTNAIDPIRHLQSAQTCTILNPPSEKYYRTKREAKFGMKMEDLSGAKRDSDIARAKEGLSKVHGWLSTNGGGKYVMGDVISYADCVLAGWLNWIRRTQGPESAVWNDLASHDGGRWGTFMTEMDAYAAVL